MKPNQVRKIAVTGANGFIGTNLVERLSVRNDVEVIKIGRANGDFDEGIELKEVDIVYHLAGVNRPESEEDFEVGNHLLTHSLLEKIARSKRSGNGSIPTIIYSSSTQSGNGSAYGTSKAQAEKLLIDFGQRHGSNVIVYRLPNVFGKWSQPYYNSVVATFCHRIARGAPVEIHDDAELELLYIDDLVEKFLGHIDIDSEKASQRILETNEGFPTYQITVKQLSNLISDMHVMRKKKTVFQTGSGLERAIYSTYLSFIPQTDFSTKLERNEDERGVFVELLRTRNSGQFSYFTSAPGVVRGTHFHNTKVEKFFVVSGQALFRFRNVVSGEYYEKRVDQVSDVAIETIPGWSHEIENVGTTELLVCLWANELFDHENPDTFYHPVSVISEEGDRK